ncbi:LytS/YhcK type 5TM receptor domain-containing protein [Saccharicrinis sp. 156]|uniref:sensor histidine kinase n=1 Tax=Saccharicrinis sp. 156 TaxID=3417574 RepID=UPI003D33CD2F
MGNSIIIELLQNTAVLLAFAMLYGSFWIKNENHKNKSKKILIGLILGGIGIVLMYTPWHWVPGITFDTRSVMLSISGLFFGPIPTAIAIAITGTARLTIGGDGQWMGISVIISSGAIGLLWRTYRPQWKTKNYLWELLGLGATVHATMAICTMLLPSEKIIPTLETITIPLIFIYTPATMLLGLVMLKQYKNWQNRLAQSKLEESESRLLKVFESGNIVSIQLNTEGNITYCNDYLMQISGYEKNEIIGKNWFDWFIAEEDRAKIYNIFNRSIHNDNPFKNHDNKILSKTGEPIFISWHNTQFKDESNTIVGIASIGVNITNNKLYENQLKEKNEEIEIQNIEYKLINEKLTEAKEKAEESERLKSAFLSNMSHEIRTPMNGILGFTDLLQAPDLTKEQQTEYIKIIENSGKRLLSIINDIIDISKIESGLMKVVIKDCNINELIQYIYTFFKPETEAKGLTLLCKNGITNNEAILQTDCEKLYAILTNLVKNAINYTEKGHVAFGYEPISDSHTKTIQFYVKDTGIGISKKHRDAIFERFIQGHTIHKMALQGTGLGLSITKSYVQMLGGKIWLESKENVGSSFFFTLPCND